METMLNGTDIWKDKRVLTLAKQTVWQSSKLLQKRSLPRKEIIFALQMSNKIIALLVIFR